MKSLSALSFHPFFIKNSYLTLQHYPTTTVPLVSMKIGTEFTEKVIAVKMACAENRKFMGTSPGIRKGTLAGCLFTMYAVSFPIS